MPAKMTKTRLPSPLSFMEKVALLEKRQGRKIIRFDLAEPLFHPPIEAIRGTISAIRQGAYRYSSSRGIPELISEVRAYLYDTRRLSYDDDEILITTGGKFANYAFFSSFFKKGDGIVILKPFWTSFGAVPEMLGLKRIDVWSGEPYHLDCDRLLIAMAQKPKAIVINTPNNPTGGMLNEGDLKLLRDLATDYDLLILSDEIDWAYAYDGRKHVSPASMLGMEDRTLVTDGFSKIFSMTGWRVGFAAGPKHMIAKMHHIQEHAVSSPATFAQYGCVEALKSRRDYIPEVVKKCDSNRHCVIKALERIEALECPLPEGGFYVYPKVSSRYATDSSTFSKELLVDGGVSVIPGNLFGDDRLTFRLCYAMEEGLLNEGLRRMEEFFEKKKDYSR